VGKVKDFLDSKIVTKDVGEETYLTWRETLSYALGRGAQGMNTSMTSSKYVNFFLTNVLFVKLKKPMDVAARIRLYCGIFDAVNDPIMGVIVDRTRTKDGQMRPYIRWSPWLVSLVMILFFIGDANASPVFNIVYTTILFVLLDVTYTAFDIPMGALAYSITSSGVERTKLFGVSSITRSIVGALPQVFVAGAALLPYFKDHTPQAYLTSAIISAVGIVVLTRFTYKNTAERAEHKENPPSVNECFRLLFHNRPLLMLFIANLLFIIVKIPDQVSFYFISDLMYNRSYNLFMDVIKFPGFLAAGVLVPWIIEKLGSKADNKKFYFICCFSGIVIQSIFALSTYGGLVGKTAGTSVSLPVGVLTVIFTGLCSFPLEFKNLIQKEMEAETVDYIEWKEGTRVEGIMLSIMSFTGKVENSFSSYLGLAFLGRTGYKQHTEGSLVQNLGTNKALFFLTTLAPAIGYLLMCVPMIFYNITGEGHKKMMEEIKKRREEAVKEGISALPEETPASKSEK